jgi:hypothetical protein
VDVENGQPLGRPSRREEGVQNTEGGGRRGMETGAAEEALPLIKASCA